MSAGVSPARANASAPDPVTTALSLSIRRAYQQAAAGPADLDLLSVYDCYSIMVPVTLEEAGVCPRGEGGPFVAEHDFSVTGPLPINPHGGQLACGQADLAGGMGHVVEAVRQLRGEAGARQAPRHELALVTGNGATLGEEVALVLAATR